MPRILPTRVWKALRWEFLIKARMLLQQFSPRFHLKLWNLRKRTDLKLNLGCFYAGKEEGWINVDAIPTPCVDFVWDLRIPSPLREGSVQYIFCEHMFEHLDYHEEALPFLKDCFRLLRSGGILRIVVPDAEKFCKVYSSNDWNEAEKLRGKDCVQTLMELVNDVFRQSGEHQFAYDEETLRMKLTEAGFTGILRSRYGESKVTGLAIDKEWCSIESLYMEAMKP